jgi:hypothetical protein
MEMSRNDRPAVPGRGGLMQNRTGFFQKPGSLDTPVYDMMQGTRRIYSESGQFEVRPLVHWIPATGPKSDIFIKSIIRWMSPIS